MAKNRFEQVDEIQDDAITLSLWKADDQASGKIICPAAIAGGRLAADMTSDPQPSKDAFRAAIRLANEIKAAVVVMDPEGQWDKEWGDLFRPID
jgi:hypothetical protein